MAQTNLPILSAEGGLSRYLQEIRKFPMLEPDEEFMLAKRYKEHADPGAAQRLITSHLRLVAKIAMGYRGYGLPISEVISEGNVGLMHAVKRFEPDKGFRLATYAMWWIRAAIQEYVLRSWSLVKIGTTAAQKRLFFNLRKIKGQIAALDDGNLHPDQIKQIATTLQVTEADVVSMNQRLSGDASLNAPMRADEGASEWQDWLVDDTPDQETTLGESEEYNERMGLLSNAMHDLNEREKAIFQARRLRDEPATLEELAQEYNVSRERIRQIEVRAFEKVQEAVQKAATAPSRANRLTADVPNEYRSPGFEPGLFFVSSPALAVTPAASSTSPIRCRRVRGSADRAHGSPSSGTIVNGPSMRLVRRAGPHAGRQLHRIERIFQPIRAPEGDRRQRMDRHALARRDREARTASSAQAPRLPRRRG